NGPVPKGCSKTLRQLALDAVERSATTEVQVTAVTHFDAVSIILPEHFEAISVEGSHCFAERVELEHGKLNAEAITDRARTVSQDADRAVVAIKQHAAERDPRVSLKVDILD